MKHLKFFSGIGMACVFFLSSCGSGEDTKDKAATTDSTTDTKVISAAKPDNVLIIKHRVANFAKWKVAYESHDSTRLSYGLHNYILGRGVKDSNTVLVALKMDDAAKAKEFSMLPNLKEAMKKGGVLGVPTFTYLDVQMLDTTTNSATTRVIIMHKVKDWDTWKKVFDSHKQARMDAGLSDRSYGYFIGDNHMVSLVFAISDLKKADAFMNSQDLKDKMKEAGVEGPPDSFVYNVVAKY